MVTGKRKGGKKRVRWKSIATWSSVLFMKAFNSDILQFGQSTHDNLGYIFNVIIAMKKINLAIKFFNGEVFRHKSGNLMIKLCFLLAQFIQSWSRKSGSFESIELKWGDGTVV